MASVSHAKGLTDWEDLDPEKSTDGLMSLTISTWGYPDSWMVFWEHPIYDDKWMIGGTPILGPPKYPKWPQNGPKSLLWGQLFLMRAQDVRESLLNRFIRRRPSLELIDHDWGGISKGPQELDGS